MIVHSRNAPIRDEANLIPKVAGRDGHNVRIILVDHSILPHA